MTEDTVGLILVQSRFDVCHRRFVGFRCDFRRVSKHLQLLVGLEDTKLGEDWVESRVVRFEFVEPCKSRGRERVSTVGVLCHQQKNIGGAHRNKYVMDCVGVVEVRLI
ncbi:hypothetical protein PFISCL1PPCAC_4534, partial [Pristionchus fissidentatus]